MREGTGGEVACCGSFRRDFVSLIPSTPLLNDHEKKTIVRILKAVSGGARKVLRSAAELQMGLNGINWRQTTITQYFKPPQTSGGQEELD